MLDMVRWMTGLGWPTRVSSTGGILIDKASKANISDTQEAAFDYGDKGTLKASVYGYDFIPEGGKGKPIHRDVTYEFEKYPEDKTEKDL